MTTATTGTYGQANASYATWGPGSGIGDYAGFQFVAPADCASIASLTMSFTAGQSVVSGVLVGMIYTDNAGNPGTKVGNDSGNGSPSMASGVNTVCTFATPPPTTPGNTYWAVFKDTSASSGDRTTNVCDQQAGYGAGRNNTITSIGTADLVSSRQWRILVTYNQVESSRPNNMPMLGM